MTAGSAAHHQAATKLWIDAPAPVDVPRMITSRETPMVAPIQRHIWRTALPVDVS
jgi:hypothetical protein